MALELILLLLFPLLCLCQSTCQNHTFTVHANALNRAPVAGPPTDPTNNQSVVNFLYQLPAFLPTFGTYNIAAEFCEPDSPNENTTVLFLLAGITYDSSYWYAFRDPDFAENSYVQYASSNGYYTLAIDLLGHGNSDHPDPLWDVQCPMDAAIVQQVVSLVRNGTIQSSEPIDWSSANFVLVGHSYGSIAGAYLTFNYPFTFDGYIFTGLAVPSGSFLPGIEMDAFQSADQVDPSRFGSLDPGYSLISNKTARRDMFYGNPGDYSPALYDVDWSLQQTTTLGELFSAALYLSDNATQLTAPVLAIIGAEDALFCSQYGTSALGMANCEDTPEGQVAQLASIFPNAPYSYLVQDCAGHSLQLHYTAPTGFNTTKTWMQQYGF